MKRRAFVSQPRFPEPDRDRGSQRVDDLMTFLQEAGWFVTFLSGEDPGNRWYARRLQQRGIAAFAGYHRAPELLSQGNFDLALLAFWEPSAKLIPIIRSQAPRTRIVVDSIDLHFLREARRASGAASGLDESYGARLVGELNAYSAADAVLTVSEKERDMLAHFLPSDRVHCLPLDEGQARSPYPFDERKGMLFVGNFRHLPNRQAVEFLCKDLVPHLDETLLEEHPLTVIGSQLDDSLAAHATGRSAIRMVGWVPSVIPYLERARVSVLPLLHGAGVKGKVLQSMMVGTPLVTTPIGAEGLAIAHGVHALIADQPADIVAATTRLLRDRDYWNRIADSAHQRAVEGHARDHVQDRFLEITEQVLTQAEATRSRTAHSEQERSDAYRQTVEAVHEIVESITEPTSVIIVISRGDDQLLSFDGRTGRHFPLGETGEWAGYYPEDSASAIECLEACRDAGADYLVVPSSSYWWLDHYDGLAAHLARYSRAFADDNLVLYDLSEPKAANHESRGRVAVVGTVPKGAPAPSANVAELSRSRLFKVEQFWGTDVSRATTSSADGRSEPGDPDWVVLIDHSAPVLPEGFLDDFLELATRLGADRAQAPHTNGPSAGPPITERLKGCAARNISDVTCLPVLAIRRGCPTEGEVWLTDAVPIGLGRPLGPHSSSESAHVLDVVLQEDRQTLRSSLRFHGNEGKPQISVLIATYDRPELLRDALEGFAAQTLDSGLYEVVVVDDGSTGNHTSKVLHEYSSRLPLTAATLTHSGRSAAKNLAAMLSRAPLILFFDDDDRPAVDLLAAHLRLHGAYPEEEVAVLGFTDWAPELDISPLMHYVTEVDKLLFAYGNLTDGAVLDWRGFWEGRVSCKRSMLMRNGLHDQRLAYSIDVEMAWRLSRKGLKVIFSTTARSHMARSLSLNEFGRRIEEKGRASAMIAALHDSPEIRTYTKVDGATEIWAASKGELASDLERARKLESEVRADKSKLDELHSTYRRIFRALNAKGIVEAPPEVEYERLVPKPGVENFATSAPAQLLGVSSSRLNEVDPTGPRISVTIPVWSRTEELADMAEKTVERLLDVASLPTEIIIVDNGSPHVSHFDATVIRFDENRGVATAWNTGIRHASAGVVAVLNSDCWVQAGWDEALYAAAIEGRRIAFPYTDHADGLGFRQPDQAGTAGWCFMMRKEIFEEIGPFDERFNPAYGEDTDYWHRAWELGIELSPVPAARVTHARRTTARTDPYVDWLLQSHRYLYGWKHGVDPLRAPPYYNRDIVEFSVQ